jgi:alginate O-acetyltransferase complex protein AlgI
VISITSPPWIAAMLATVACYWLLPRAWRREFLVAVSAVFLLLVDLRALLLIAVFVTSSWLFTRHRGRATLVVALCVPLAVLIYFKVRANADPLSTLEGVAIPLGLSYTVFRVLHYVIERSRDNLPAHGFADYLAYIFFLPTLLVGPINRFGPFLADRRDGRWRAEQISGGLERILIGYFKVTVLGNLLLAHLADHWVERAAPASPPLAYYLEAVLGSLNLYIQFSGFSDVAIGFALMLGHRIMENFRFPFLQTNIADFWRCWHISLTSWSREYIFMTALSLTRRPYVATLCSLLFIGIWHEISLRYVAWGVYHGLGIIAYMQWRKLKQGLGLRTTSPHALPAMIGRILAALLTANYFFFGFLLTSEPTLRESLAVMGVVLGGLL